MSDFEPTVHSPEVGALEVGTSMHNELAGHVAERSGTVVAAAPNRLTNLVNHLAESALRWLLYGKEGQND